MVDKIPFLDFGGTGQVFHFAHSNGYPPGCFQPLLTLFTDQYHVTAMFLRPLWPGSQPDKFVDWQTISDDLYQFLQQQGFEQVVGVGHSLGAVATMKTAIRYPALFKALVLIEPVFMPPEILSMIAADPEKAKLNPLYQKTVRRRNRWPDRQAAFDHFRAKAVFQRWSDEALWAYIDSGFQETADGQLALVYRREWEAQIYAHFPLTVWQEVPQMQQPTLAVRAAESETLLLQAWQLWQDLQPQAQFVEIPEAGHMVPAERPTAVAAEISKFLNSIA